MAEPWYTQEPVPTGIVSSVTLLLGLLGHRVQVRLKNRSQRVEQVDREHALTDYAHELRRWGVEATAVRDVRIAFLETALREAVPTHPLLSAPAIPYAIPPDWPKAVPP